MYTPTTDLYTLSLHDALPISPAEQAAAFPPRISQPRNTRRPQRHCRPDAACRRVLFRATCGGRLCGEPAPQPGPSVDRKSTRLNSSHLGISYAVFCLKKKKDI